MKVKIATLNTFLLFCQLGFGQMPSFKWANTVNGNGTELVNDIKVDKKGNIYCAGSFSEPVDLNPGSGTQLATSKGSGDFFVQKFNVRGELLWAFAMGGTKSDFLSKMAIDKDNNILLVGSFQDTVDFDPSSRVDYGYAKSTADIFVMKLDAQGKLVWKKTIGGSGTDVGNTITVDANNDVIVSGIFSKTTDFDPGKNKYEMSSKNYSDVFILKLSTKGEFVWAKSIEGDYSKAASGLAVDNQQNILLTGYFEDTANFNTDPGKALHLISKGSIDFYVLKLNTKGDFIWAHATGGIGPDNTTSLTVLSNNNIVVAGRFGNTVDFDPSTRQKNIKSIGNSDICIVSYNEKGKLNWVKRQGGIKADLAYAIDHDNYNNILVAAQYADTIIADTGKNSRETKLVSKGASDIMVEKLRANGDFVFAFSVGGSSIESPRAITFHPPSNSLLLGGYFSTTVDFDIGTGTSNNISQKLRDAFIAMYEIPCYESRHSFKLTSCGNYTSPSGKEIRVSEVFKDTIANQYGCDSILTIDLTVNSKPIPTISFDGSKLKSNNTYKHYQWFLNSKKLIGDTLIELAPSINGIYTLEVMDNVNCQGSANYVLSNVSIETPFIESIKLFPNPVLDKLNFKLPEGEKTIKVFNVNGKLVKDFSTTKINFGMDLNTLENGYYLFQVSMKNKISNHIIHKMGKK